MPATRYALDFDRLHAIGAMERCEISTQQYFKTSFIHMGKTGVKSIVKHLCIRSKWADPAPDSSDAMFVKLGLDVRGVEHKLSKP